MSVSDHGSKVLKAQAKASVGQAWSPPLAVWTQWRGQTEVSVRSADGHVI